MGKARLQRDIFERVMIASVASLALAGGGAHAQMVSSITGTQLESALSGAGLSPEMTEDAVSGAPVARGQVGEFTFWVRAMECSGSPKACENLLFFANFELGRAAKGSDYQIVNQYNESQLFGRAYIIEEKSQVGIDYVIELGGGVSAEHVTENIARWSEVVAAFVREFTQNAAGS